MFVDVHARVVEFEGRKIIANIVRDITDHKRVEEALEKSEAGLAEAQHVAQFLNFAHPDDRELVKKSIDEALYENKPFSIDHRIVLLDGSERFKM